MKNQNVESRKGNCIAFTLIELLVVIAIIAILAAILLPVLEQAQQRGYRASCMSNLHQQGMAFTIYTSDDNNKYPDWRYPPYGVPGANPPQSYGYWPWDAPVSFCQAMINDGCTRNVFYDPAYAQFNCSNSWYFSSTYSVLDYVYLLPGAGMNAGGIYPENPFWKTNALPQPGQPPAVDEPLVADVVCYESSPVPGYANINNIGGFASLHPPLVQRTSHLNGVLPAGGNILYEDGHVGWVNWNLMYNNGHPKFIFGNNPIFYIWQNYPIN